jgi:hypothetical protein
LLVVGYEKAVLAALDTRIRGSYIVNEASAEGAEKVGEDMAGLFIDLLKREMGSRCGRYETVETQGIHGGNSSESTACRDYGEDIESWSVAELDTGEKSVGGRDEIAAGTVEDIGRGDSSRVGDELGTGDDGVRGYLEGGREEHGGSAQKVGRRKPR